MVEHALLVCSDIAIRFLVHSSSTRIDLAFWRVENVLELLETSNSCLIHSLSLSKTVVMRGLFVVKVVIKIF